MAGLGLAVADPVAQLSVLVPGIYLVPSQQEFPVQVLVLQSGVPTRLTTTFVVGSLAQAVSVTCTFGL